MKKNITTLVFALSMFPLLWVNADDVPSIMNYQGSVKTTAGAPYNGNGYFKFAIVNPAGDTAYWSNDGFTSDGTEPTGAPGIPVAVSNGLFSVGLGDTTLTNMSPISASVFNNSSTYLRTWFSDDGTTFSQLSPDQQIVSGAYAIKAQSAETAVSKTGDTMTGGLTVPSLTYSSAQTRYLTIAGSQCSGKNLEPLDSPFFCELSTTTTDTDAYWSVNLPNGAAVTGLRAYVYSISDTTTCTLRRGDNNAGSAMASVTRVNQGWGLTIEDTTISNATVDNSSYAYVVHCTRAATTAQSVIGAIRIRYTVTSP